MILVWLKLIPAREWCYFVALIALSCSFIWFVEHERDIGKTECEARVTAATADIQAKLDSEQSATAQAVAKFHVLDQAIKNAAYPSRPAIATCADADPRVVQRANADN